MRFANVGEGGARPLPAYTAPDLKLHLYNLDLKPRQTLNPKP